MQKSAEVEGVERRLHKVRAHLKYTWADQRTEEYDQKKPRKVRGASMTGHEICRMSALDAVNLGSRRGFLRQLKGAPCENPKCDEHPVGFGVQAG